MVGGISTTWRGTAFNCPGHGNEITLPHAQFKTGGTTVMCNNGMIIGHNLSRALDFDGSNYKFTSQLFIHLPLLNDANNTLDDRTVECIRFNGTTGDVIGNLTIAYARVSNGIYTYFVATQCHNYYNSAIMTCMQLNLLIAFA